MSIIDDQPEYVETFTKNMIDFLIVWNDKITDYSRNLNKAMRILSDYTLLNTNNPNTPKPNDDKSEIHNIMTDEECKLYIDRVSNRFLKYMIQAVEEVSKDILVFFTFTRSKITRLKHQYNTILKHLTSGYKMNNNQWLTDIDIILQDIAYDVQIKHRIFDEIRALPLDNKRVSPELLRLYLICIQNHCLIDDIDIIIQKVQRERE